MVKRILALSLLMVGLAGCGSGGPDVGPSSAELVSVPPAPPNCCALPGTCNSLPFYIWDECSTVYTYTFNYYQVAYGAEGCSGGGGESGTQVYPNCNRYIGEWM